MSGASATLDERNRRENTKQSGKRDGEPLD